MPGSSPHYRKRCAKQVAKKAALKKDLESLSSWTPMHRARVGLYMVEVARAAGIIPRDKAIKYVKNQTVVYSDEFIIEIFGHEEMVIKLPDLPKILVCLLPN